MKHRQKIHFIGIGGAGMSGIAEVLLNLGHQVTGSDLKSSEIVQRLRRLGAQIFVGHRREHVPDEVDVVVVSNAVPATNPEILEAEERGVPVVPRAELLNDLMRLKQGVAIAGTHGKTTTTSMVAWILAQAGLDPTMVIGGILNNIDRGARMGKGEYFVVEACEAFSSFLHLSPVAVAVLNIDDDHLENYGGSRTALEDAFLKFINSVPFWGVAVLNGDDPGIRAIAGRVIRRVVTFGFEASSEIRAEAPAVSELTQNFMVWRKNRRLGRIQLRIPGRFNVQNALAAIALALELGVPFEVIRRALENFTGVRRRFERKGQLRGAQIIDDYGHHPTEVAATLTAARGLKPTRLLVVFQPHLFSRTQRLYREFARALSLADRVYIADIYPARERPIPGVSAQLIVDQLHLEGNSAVTGPLSLAGLKTKLQRELHAGDMLLTMGAGDVWKLGEQLVKKTKAAPTTLRRPKAVRPGRKSR